jgi:hypothetical protein
MHRLAADTSRRQALGITDLRGQRQRPDTGRPAIQARALVQQGTQTLPPLRVEDGLGPVGPGWCRLEGSHSPLVEGMNRVADRLIMAPQVARNGSTGLALGTGQQYLTAADCKGLGRAEAARPS